MERKISPKEFLEYAKKNRGMIKDDSDTLNIINTYGCVSKGFHSQVDELIGYLKDLIKPKSNLEHFPEKIAYLQQTALFTPEQILKLNKLRNDLEHRYLAPSKETVSISIAFLEYFIRDANSFMKTPSDQLRRNIENKLSELRKLITKKFKNENTINSFLLQTKKFFLYTGKTPNILDSEDLNNYLIKIEKDGHGPQVIQHIQWILEFMYKNLLNKEYELTFKRPLIKQVQIKPYNDKIIQKIFKTNMGLRDNLILKFIYYTGIDYNKLKDLTIEKLNKNYSKPIKKISKLKEYVGVRNNGHVFLSNNNKPLGERGIQHIFERLSNKIGQRIQFKNFRISHPDILYKYQTKFRKSYSRKEDARPRTILKKNEVITQKEFNNLINKIKDTPHRELLKKYYLYFIYHLGIEFKQFRNVKLKDIDYQKKIIFLEKSKHSKFKEGIIKPDHHVFIELAKYIKRFNIQDYLFNYWNSNNTIRKAIKDYGQLAGIDKVKLSYGQLAHSKYFQKRYNLK